MRAMQRMSFEDLVSFLAHDQEDADLRQFVSVDTEFKVLPATVARRTGVSRQTVYRWATSGVPIWTADRIAVRMGVHPIMIWPHFHEGVNG